MSAHSTVPVSGGIAPATRGFAVCVFVLATIYLALQSVYALRLPLIMDEFPGAHTVNRLGSELPYRDFRPYKTVLGYYLQYPLLASQTDSWRGLMAVRLGLALLNTLVFSVAAFRLRRLFRPGAVLLSTAMLAFMSTLLERGIEFRVDMLTALAGLASLFCLLERRHVAAGLFVALSFCVSQKGVYYVLAAQAALWIGWMAWRTRAEWQAIVRFSLASAAGLGAYLAFWSLLGSPASVLGATFLSHTDIALGDLYDIQLRYWGQTIGRNPLFYSLALAGLALLDRRRRSNDPAWRLVPYAATLFVLCAWHKQPWPYFFVLIIPTVFVVATAGVDRLLEAPRLRAGTGRLVAVIVFVSFGVLWPLLRLPPNLRRDAGIQRESIRLAESLLTPNDTYLAGVDIVYRHRQPTAHWRWLDRPRATALKRATPAELDALVAELETAPPLLIIDSYRIQNLPNRLRRYLGQHYAHLAANVFVRSPLLTPDRPTFEVAFAGEYVVLASQAAEVRIDGRPVAVSDRLTLDAGPHDFEGEPTRLQLSPSGRYTVPAEYSNTQPLFPNVYDY